ncbi:MAG: DUF6421 family protein [Nocardioides sp.]
MKKLSFLILSAADLLASEVLVTRFPVVGVVHPAADGSIAIESLRRHGHTIARLAFSAPEAPDKPADLAHVDTVVVDRATPELPELVWSWVRNGGGLVCVGAPSAAVAGQLADLTRHQWRPADSPALVSLAAPVTNEVPAVDLLAGVGELKAASSSWCPHDSPYETWSDRPTTDVLAGGPAERTVPFSARTVLWTESDHLPAVLAIDVGAGRVALVADPGLVSDSALAAPQLGALWHNLVTWTAGTQATSAARTERHENVEPTRRAESATGADSAAGQRTRTSAEDPAWLDLKAAVGEFRDLQAKDGSVADGADKRRARVLLTRITGAVRALAPRFPHDADYLDQLQADLAAWSADGVGVPDFLDSLLRFRPELGRVDGREHLVLFPMYTQNGNPNRQLEAVLLRVVWPDFVAELERTYANPAFVPVSFIDFTAGYDTASAVLFPETVAVREVPKFTWGAIFCDREAARFRRVIGAAVDTMRLPVPPDAARLLASHELAQETFVAWDLIHDRAHSRGDLPFDPFMIKQRMPFWLYSLEELRCDLTAFRAAVELEHQGMPHARLIQYAIFFDRTFRFPITGGRTRNYDGLGGQLLFAYLHQSGVVNWTDNRLSVDWERLPAEIIGLLEKIEHLYWRSIDRPKMSHWIAAYELVTSYVEPHPASIWAQGRAALPLTGELKELTNLVMPDEFPLSMFFEALHRRLSDVVAGTSGITAPH